MKSITEKMKVTKVICFFTVLLIISASCNAPFNSFTTTKPASLIGAWNYNKVLKNGLEVKQVSQKDIIQLSADSTFYYYLLLEGIYATGSWQVMDSLLQLTYDVLPSGKGTDEFYISKSNVDYVIGEDTITKSLGLPIDTLEAGEVIDSLNNMSPRIVRNYTIEELDSTQFVISEKGIRFSFFKK